MFCEIHSLILLYVRCVVCIQTWQTGCEGGSGDSFPAAVLAVGRGAPFDGELADVYRGELVFPADPQRSTVRIHPETLQRRHIWWKTPRIQQFIHSKQCIKTLTLNLPILFHWEATLHERWVPWVRDASSVSRRCGEHPTLLKAQTETSYSSDRTGTITYRHSKHLSHKLKSWRVFGMKHLKMHL